MRVCLARMFRFVCLFSIEALALAALASSVAAQTSPQILITNPVDENQLTVLKGNTHPLARAEFDQGAAPADLPVNRMLLVLKRSDQQEAALRTLIDSQQDKASPNYHNWLTPETFGKQFGPSDQDIAQVTTWLQSHGFQIAQVSRGRTIIEFSGTVAQVQEAFHTAIHKYVVKGEQHWANATDPQIPAALTAVVSGVLSLHNFVKKPNINLLDEQIPAKYVDGQKPEFTSSTGRHALTPADYNVIYNIPLLSYSYGPLATIAIVGRTNINLQDISNFHSLTSDGARTPQVVVNGADPGDLGGGEEAEAVLDSTWSGAVDPNALVTLVVSGSTNSTDGVDLSELYIIDNNLADVMSESFGGCEADETSADASAVSSLAQQAAAEGITYTVSTGDSGAAGCDDPNSETVATGPFSVNILASTPYTVAVGGTMFNENGQDSTYWGSTNSSSLESALSYIPEKVWNESCTGTSCGATKPGIWAGSGGASTLFSKPAWQTGFGDAARDLPDVSLTAAGHDPYLLCLDNSCVPNSQGEFYFAGVSGTSASAPSFAGIIARVVINTGSRQGQANYVLYKLAGAETFSQCNGSKPSGLASTCAFNDITLGNNSVPGDTDYGSPTAKYQSSVGYDLATGLGSVNVTNLLNSWNTANFNATTTTLSISPLTAIHGAAFNVKVQVTANSGKPSGSIWLQQGNLNGSLIGDNTSAIFPLDSSSSFMGTTHVLDGGNHAVSVHYTGDSTFAASDSPPVTVNIQPEPSTTSLSVLTNDQNGNLVPFTSGPYGTPVYFKTHVAGASGYGVPTFWVAFSTGENATLDENGDGLEADITSFIPGTYPVVAHYVGDQSFAPSSSAPIPFSITQAPTTISLTVFPQSQGAVLTAFVNVTGGGNPPTGSLTFYSGMTILGSQPLGQIFQNGVYQPGANFSDPQLANGQYSFTASYNGDGNYIGSSSPPAVLALQPDFSLAAIGTTSESILPGGPANYVFTVNYYDGFAGTVTFTCSGLPTEAACIVPPLNAAGVGALTITTTAPTAQKAASLSRRAFWGVFSLGFAGILLLGAPVKHRRSSALLSLFLLAFLGVGIGCGGGGGGGVTSSNSTTTTTPTVPSNPGTAAGNYTVTVTGTSGTISHSAQFTLTVQ